MKVKKRTPSGRISVHKRREHVARAKCANCKSPLHGMPKLSQSGIKKMSASDKNPNRPYGGNLCSGCSKEVFRHAARSI